MSLQIDLAHPDLGYFDERLNLTEKETYRDCLASLGEATVLPPVSFRSKVFLEMENEQLWTREWIAIALEQQFLNIGDMVPFTVGFHGVHIQKTNEGEYSARLNRHQHGGCRFVPEQCRTGKQTKCTIASCNYTRDSKVMRAKDDGENSDEMYKFAGLVPEKLHQINYTKLGKVFLVNVDPSSRGVEPKHQGVNIKQIAEISEKLASNPEEHWLDFDCNWKLFVDEFCKFSSWDKKPAWLFPNLLCAELNNLPVIVVVQATGMNKTLARCYINSNISSNDLAILDNVKMVGQSAIHAHSKFASWGTSLAPETVDEELPLVETPDFLKFHRYLIDIITKKHNYGWNAPVMDGRMLQRR